MNFQTAIAACLGKYGTFRGRAARSEFWWFYLFTILLSWGATLVGNSMSEGMGTGLPMVVNLALMVPTFAAGCRRLHDIGKSGWWQLLILTVIGIILLIIWWAKDTQPEANAHGDPAMTAEGAGA
ncbi:MAG: DUF805 domain-containing protein [Magnetospirillum sp.]|nr:DUF805 domain-containing protein [Magnetospirillum sp.]